MANQVQLNLLRQSVQDWNRWRDEAPEVVVDLSGANLIRANLNGANLSGANLSEANLSEANLSEANLSEANLSEAKLSEAKLSEASLFRAILRKANLSGADLNAADLSSAYLSEAKLMGANLRVAILTAAELTSADLSEADLSGAKLIRANLYKTNLSEADLSETELSLACLIFSNAERATLTNSCLFETQRSGWIIKNVICEAVFWDDERLNLIHYQLGEFERLFSEKTKIFLHYKDGIEPLEIASLPALIQNLVASHPGCKLRLKSIEDASGGAVVTIVIDEADYDSPEELEKLRILFQSEAEQKAAYLRQAFEQENLLLKGEIRGLEKLVDKFLSKPTYYLKEGNINMGDEYNNSGQAGAFGANAHAHDNTFNQIVNQLEKSINLSDLAQQLADLRQAAAAKQDTSAKAAIAVGNLAAAEEAANEKNPSKVVASLKAAGEWALDLAKDIGKEVAIEAIKQSMGMP